MEETDTMTYFEDDKCVLDITIPDTVTPDHPENIPLNDLQCPSGYYEALAVKFILLVRLKAYLSRWPDACVTWIDMSAA